MFRPKIIRAAAATRSGLRRYPKQILESLRTGAVELPKVSPRLNFESFGRGRFSAAWIGHATVLIRMGGRTILTDPVFSHRIGMSVGGVTLGIQRLLPPAADVEHLPRIDLVLLSHAHFDHLDKPSLRRLAEGPARGAMVITADRTRALIPEGFGEVVQLGWGRQVRVGDLRVEALQPRHWGARAAVDQHRKYNAYVLEHGVDRVLFAGDTALTDAFERVGPVALSVFGIGAYESWDNAHATPEQVWHMFLRSGGRAVAGSEDGRGLLLPMHHSTFDMGERHAGEPMQRLIAAAGAESDRIVCKDVGEVWSKPDPNV